MVGLMVVLIVVVALALSLYYQSKGHLISENDLSPDSTKAPMRKVPAANIEDGEYHAYLVSINASPEDNTLTFKPVTYFDGEEAIAAAKSDGRESEVRNGVYVHESGAPNFTVPVTLVTEEVVTALRNKMNNITYKPVFLVKIQNGAVISVEEVGRK